MNNKNLGKELCLGSGIFGLIGGIILVIAPLLLISTLSTDIISESGASTSGSVIIFTIIKIASIALGILCLIKYKGCNQVITGGPILLIVGGAVALIPFIGSIGGIIMIIGGGICLGSLGRFKKKEMEEQK
ncbi:hypothetical protein OKW22_000246 [Bacilli bacterium PM5-3]|nr:hypothetical protein [Bacilli bacterium PM5-3]MDH6603337.1 hypothetical protein [Bacilli bacterium PM5-9]